MTRLCCFSRSVYALRVSAVYEVYDLSIVRMAGMQLHSLFQMNLQTARLRPKDVEKLPAN